MRKLVTISSVIILSVLSSFAANSIVDWSFFFSASKQQTFWLLNDSTAVVLYGNNQPNTYYYNYHTVQFWDLNNDKLMKEITGSSDYSYHPTISAKYNEIATLSYSSIKFWDLDNLELKDSLPFEEQTNSSIDNFWFDNSLDCYFASFQSKDSITILKISGNDKQIIGKLMVSAKNNYFYPTVVAADGKFALQNDSNQIDILNSKDFNLEQTFKIEKKIDNKNISPNGNYLAIYSKNLDSNHLIIYNLKTKVILNKFNLKPRYGDNVCFSNDEQKIILSNNFSYIIYEINDSTPKNVINAGSYGRNMQFCGDNRQIIDLGQNLPLKIINIDNAEDREFLFNLNDDWFESGLRNIKADENNFSYFTFSNSSFLTQRSLVNDSILDFFELNDNYVDFVNSNLKDSLLLYNNHEIIIWDMNQNLQVKSILANLEKIYNPKISSDLHWLASGSYKSGLILFDLTENKKYYLDSGRIWSNAYDFSSDSKYLAEGGTNNLLRIFDLTKMDFDTSQALTIQTDVIDDPNNTDTTGLIFVKFFQNDSILITSSNSIPLFKVWNVSDGKLIANAISPNVYNGDTLRFGSIINIFYRDKFDDYCTIENQAINYWTKNFSFNEKFGRKGLPISYDGNLVPYYFDYLNNNNKLIACSARGERVCFSLETPSDDVKDFSVNVDNATLYPNPTHDELWIDAPNDAAQSRFEIVNLLGETVLSQPFASRISVANLTAGVYFVRIGDKMYPFVKN